MINRITPVSFRPVFGAKSKTVGETAKVKKTSMQNPLERPQTGDVFTSSKTESEKSGAEENVAQKKTKTDDAQNNESQIDAENA